MRRKSARTSPSAASSARWCSARSGSSRSRKAGQMSPSGVRNTFSLAAIARLTRPPRPESDRLTIVASLTATISSAASTKTRRRIPGILMEIAMAPASDFVPRREAIGDPFQRGPKLGELAQQGRLHRIVANPSHSELGVDLGPEVVGEETVALQAPRGHQDENPEGGVAEAKTLGQVLRQQPDQ